MPDRKRLITIGGTLCAIAGIGFFMQNGQSGPSQAGLNRSAPEPAQEMLDLSSAELTASDTIGTSAGIAPPEPDAAPMEIAALDDVPRAQAPAMTPPGMPENAPMAPAPELEQQAETDQTAPETAEQVAARGDAVIMVEPETDRATASETPGSDGMTGCDPSMELETIAAAMVRVVVDAQCLPNERVTLEHSGMSFTEATDAEGMLDITVPALAEEAQITATFRDGHAVFASTMVNSLAFYDRAVIQSDSESAITLHALEYGAGYSDTGHIWSGAAGGIENAATGKGGFLITLGDSTMDKARIAEVYTFPTGIARDDGLVELSVEIEVTEYNCARALNAEAFQIGASGGLTVQSLDLTMPDCDAIGDFLVLKNLVNDLKVARN